MLRERGHTLVGVDTGFFVAEDGETAAPASDGGTHRLDVRRMGPELLQGIDAVIHLAALSNDPMGELDPALTDAINHRASVRLARMAREAGVERFVFASSCSLYGAADSKGVLDESAPFNPVTAYARSKVDAEAGLAELAAADFAPVFLRAGTVYGLSPAMRFDLVANNLVGWALTTGRIHLESDGSPWRPLVHVEDLARAYVAAVEAPRETVANQAFNVGRDDQNFQVRDIADTVRAAVAGCGLEMAPNAGPDTRSYRVSFRKAEETLPGFEVRWTLEKGVRQMVGALGQRRLTREEFLGPRYIRLVRLRRLRESGRLSDELYWSTAGSRV